MQQSLRIGRILGTMGQVAAAGALVLVAGCASRVDVGEGPAPMSPSGPEVTTLPRPVRTAPPARLVNDGDVVWGEARAEIIETGRVRQVEEQAWGGLPTPVKNMLPTHVKPGGSTAGAPNALEVGQVLDEPRTITEMMFPTISATGWVPPDPTLAVSPTHVLVTVNQDIAWYTRAGAQQFRSNLGSPGNPGFFEPLGAQNFVFDPKVIYDHYAQRFVVLALEVYNSTEAWITFAVSDDSDPNGTWYKYRTDAVLDIGTNTVWWDFPGIGYDQNAYYVTGNLFSLPSGGSYGGAGIRIFNKAPLLTGGTATYSTLRIAGAYTVMPALHFGNPSVPYFVDPTSSTNVRVYAVTNPLTSPTIATTNVTVPSTTGAIEAPTRNGNPLSNADITMPYWRNGRLSMIQNASVSGRNVARWHEFNTNNWPTSGSVTRVQSGDVDAGLDYHTLFPAIASNANGDLGVVIGRTSASERVGVAVAGRRAADPVGRMGYPVIVKAGDRDGGGRWGDYQAVAVDPVDDTTFWVIGEYLPSGSGWQNWVTSFRVSDQSLCHPIPDSLGAIQTTTPRTIDVLANDWHSTAAVMTIDTFATTSTRGGTIIRSVGTGPGGRDQLVYTPPATLPNGADSFSYTVRDPSGNTASAAVVATLYNPATYRAPDAPIATRGGVRVRYYDLNAPTVLPDFSTLNPFAEDVVPQINYPSGGGTFATSTRSDNIGAVFEGYVDVPATDLYTFYTNSDDGSKLYLGGQLIVNNDGAHGMVERGSSLQGLRAGKHRVRVEFFEGGGSQGLIVSYEGQNLAKQVIPSVRWSIDRCVADVDNGTGSGVPDGGVTIDDLLYYLSIFEAGLSSADVDDGSGTGTRDGGVTIDDLLFYLVRFEAGC
jgi:hypothetical protein